MRLVKEIEISDLTVANGLIFISDDFQDEIIPPYGEPLFYKIIACRKVKYVDIDSNEQIDYVPSKPTKSLLANIVDNVNPSAPKLTETIASTANDELSGLVLNWNKTAHNAKYILFKMNNAGNWSKVHEVKSNDEAELTYSFADPVPKVNDDGIAIYHRFKVSVENSSGLFNLEEKILTI